MPNVDFAKKAVVKVVQRSAFDKSFRNLLTTKCGTLTPILCDEVIANSTVNLKLAISATLPPLASETFMNVNLKTEAFFVPTRLLMPGYEQFIQGNTKINVGSTVASAVERNLRCPVVTLTAGQSTTDNYLTPGSLADYLGFRATLTSGTVNISAFPFLAYHFIWDTWYRNSLVQNSCFNENQYYSTSTTWYPVAFKYIKPCDSPSIGYSTTLGSSLRDGVKLGELRQRNFGSDYFTTATPSPQNGSAQKVSMALPYDSLQGVSLNGTSPVASDASIDSDNVFNADDIGISGVSFVSGSDSSPVNLSFTIASLRAANSLQMWLERNQLSNDKFVDFLKVQYNANLKDSIAQRPIYLGSASFPVYNKGVYQTGVSNTVASSNQPFDVVGARYGHAYSEGTDFIIDHYTAEEPGYIMVLASLVPEVTYSGGVNKYLMRYTEQDSYGDMANPILQNVGPEPIRCYEFDYQMNDDDSFGVFGYTDRFGSWMTRNHELHGLLRDGQSLESFALQRTGLADGIGSTFLTIPTTYMDQVTAVDSAISTYGVWIDSYLDYKVVMPLAKYSIPSLQDPAYEHGDTVVVNRRGRIME